MLKSFTLKSHQKQLMLMRGEERKNKKRTTQELQDQNLLGSSHLEEEWIGGNVDLDHLSLFLQRYARIMGGIERGQAIPKVNNGGERGKKQAQMVGEPLGKKGDLYRSSQKRVVAGKTAHRIFLD